MNNWFSPLYSLLFLAFWRISYEAANGIEQVHQPEMPLAAGPIHSENPPTSQTEWAEKAVRKYAESQDKKWRNWREAMFEKGS